MRLTYELVKELKDAGFPQVGGTMYAIPQGAKYDDGYGLPDIANANQVVLVTENCQSYLKDGKLFLGEYGNDNYCGYAIEELIRIPTLAELIEVCGRNFYNLERLRAPDEEGSFWAIGKENERAGITAEEAVARLWLALNKKI